MPAVQKKRKKAKSRRGYYFGALVLAVIIALGVYAYASSQPPAIVYATLDTTQGVIKVELYQSKTPKTVTNFVNLAKEGFYNNLVWHRIVNGFVIQTGDQYTKGAVNSTRDSWGKGGSPEKIPQELDPSLHNDAFYLGMARGDDINSATSQFYINLADNRDLDTRNGGYAVFGKVTAGIDVVNRIASVNTYLSPPAPTDLKDQPIDASSVMLTSVKISNSP